jgi:hypothetical protein
VALLWVLKDFWALARWEWVAGKRRNVRSRDSSSSGGGDVDVRVWVMPLFFYERRGEVTRWSVLWLAHRNAALLKATSAAPRLSRTTQPCACGNGGEFKISVLVLLKYKHNPWYVPGLRCFSRSSFHPAQGCPL